MGSEIRLRAFQPRACDQVLAHLANNRSTILVAPTGSGKTVMGVWIVSQLVWAGLRVAWCAHTRELVYQASKTMETMGVGHGLIMAQEPECPLERVQVCSIQTVMARGWDYTFDVIVVDEAHHAVADNWSATIRGANAKVTLGLTATPYRLDGKGLGRFFDEMVIAATPRELCEAGLLVAPRVYAPCTPDMSRVKVQGGDYVTSAAAAIMCQKEIVGNIVDHWDSFSRGRPTIGFACNVEHAHVMSNRFRDAGVQSVAIDGTMPKPVRDEIFRKYNAREYQMIWNCQIATEGVDIPHLETAIIARPTASMSLHRQMIGRVMRICDGKAGALVLDHAGNSMRHGLVTTDLFLSLDEDEGFRKSEGSDVTTCKSCLAIILKSETTCPCCGAPTTKPEPENKRPAPVETDDVLVDVGDGMDWRAKEEEWKGLLSLAMASGYKPGWAMYRWKERHGEWPLIYEGKLVHPMAAPVECRKQFFTAMRVVAARKGYKPGWVAFTFKGKFGKWPPRAWGSEPMPATVETHKPAEYVDDVPF